jgi:ATP-dependent helicase/nuclease subunit B
MAAVSAGTTVLAPNTELAGALFDAVQREYRDTGREVWNTPRVRDFGSWLREQYVQQQLADATSPRCLSDVEERELWRSAIDSSDLAHDFLDPAAAARAARRARRTLHEYGIPLRALAAHPSQETQAFLEWNREFEQRCRTLGVISSDTLLAAPPASGAVTWIESAVWRPVARAFLRRHAGPLEPQGATARHTLRFKAASPDAEIAATAQWALRNLRATPGFRAWVCIPDLGRRRAEVADAFDAVLMPQRFALREDLDAAPYALAGGTPLSEFAPVRAALESLAATVGTLDFARFGALLRLPELQDSESDAIAAARLDVALRERAPSEADLGSWLDLADSVARAEQLGPVAALQRLHAVNRHCARLQDAQAFSTWVPMWIAALEAGPWALRSRWSSSEYQAAERLRELLASLAMGDAVFGANSRAMAQRMLRRAARDTAFQIQTGVAAVWVSSQYLDPWLNYDGVWISGCSDQQWPAPVDPVALIPISLQREYAVSGASAESQMISALNLQRGWQARAAQCVFSSADPGDGRISAPSPLLPLATSMHDCATPPQTQPHWRAQSRNSAPLQSLMDEWAPPFSTAERTHGVATLKAQSRCAFRGFAESRLGAQPLQLPVPGFNERERGELVHHALEHIWSELRDWHALQALSADTQRSLVEAATSRALASVCKRRDPGRRWRERERVRLASLLGRWLAVERQRLPFAVEHIEQGAQVAQFAGLDFRVRIDREDLLPDGARILIDYKTGAAARDWGGDRPDNPQLPIYALLRPQALIAVAYGRVNAVDPEFVADSERANIFRPGSRSSRLEGMANFAALVELWRGRVQTLAADFAAGRAEVAPTRSACRSCHLQGLCRIPAALDAQDAT